MLRRKFLAAVCLFAWPAFAAENGLERPKIDLPIQKGGLLFAVIGDTGTGGTPAIEVAQQLANAHEQFPFKFAAMMGDNLYGGEKPRDFERKFEGPYMPLVNAGVKFYAALGNHDDVNQTKYKYFNMDGKRYYSFQPGKGVRFFALDSNYMDREQLEWLTKELEASRSEWKVCFFPHPLYSSGARHGPSLELRRVLEPLFIQHGVNLVLSGHEHFYERIKPQHGIYYFIMGSSAKLRRGGIRKTDITATGYDQDRAFMLMEIAGDELYFQTISRSGETLDSGVLPRQGAKKQEVSQRSAR